MRISERVARSLTRAGTCIIEEPSLEIGRRKELPSLTCERDNRDGVCSLEKVVTGDSWAAREMDCDREPAALTMRRKLSNF